MMNKVPLNGNGSQKKRITVTPDDLTFTKCECGSENFRDAWKLGKLSALHPKNDTGKTQIVPVPIYVCVECDDEMPVQNFAE